MTTQGEEPNCSEGARMLIERMQTHPKDFKADGRFARITDQILGKLPVGFSDLSDRDDTALSEAFGKYILEPRLTEYVVDEIFNGDRRRAEEQRAQSDRYAQSLAASMMATKNAVSSNAILGAHGLGTSAVNAAQGQALWSTGSANVAISNGGTGTSITAGQQWFEEEKRRLSEMTTRTLAKIKRRNAK